MIWFTACGDCLAIHSLKYARRWPQNNSRCILNIFYQKLLLFCDFIFHFDFVQVFCFFLFSFPPSNERPMKRNILVTSLELRALIFSHIQVAIQDPGLCIYSPTQNCPSVPRGTYTCLSSNNISEIWVIGTANCITNTLVLRTKTDVLKRLQQPFGAIFHSTSG